MQTAAAKIVNLRNEAGKQKGVVLYAGTGRNAYFVFLISQFSSKPGLYLAGFLKTRKTKNACATLEMLHHEL